MQQLSMIIVSNLILGYSSATSSQHCRNNPSPSFLSMGQREHSADRVQGATFPGTYPMQSHVPHMILALWTAVTLPRPFLVA